MTRILCDAEAIRSLANILRDAGLTEIEIVEADSRIRVVRAPAPATAVHAAAVPAQVAAVVPSPAPVAEEGPPAGAVPSPMVGIAFLSPEPGSAPFVTVGQAVAAGQTLMLIEAMKTFNQIKSPRAGTLTRILVASGEPVEYDQPLMVIE